MSRIVKLLVILASLMPLSCATNIKPSNTFNPPPAEAFSAFARFELKPVTLAQEYSGHSANQRAAAKIQQYFDQRVKTVVDGWNARPGALGRTLVIEPNIEQIKFIAVGARIFAGPFAGSSAVVLKVKYTDKESGKIVAHPEFFQRAAAMSGALTYGGQDNAMLARIVTLVADYNARNYSERVGGENGMGTDAAQEGEQP
jgi:hypothetical protein